MLACVRRDPAFADFIPGGIRLAHPREYKALTKEKRKMIKGMPREKLILPCPLCTRGYPAAFHALRLLAMFTAYYIPSRSRHPSKKSIQKLRRSGAAVWSRFSSSCCQSCVASLPEKASFFSASSASPQPCG